MNATRQKSALGLLLGHFALIGWVCSQGMVQSLGYCDSSATLTPRVRTVLYHNRHNRGRAESKSANLLRRALDTYINSAGIEAGYGYFAPNIPFSHALVFECRDPSGRVEYRSPGADTQAARLRLSAFIEQAGRTDYEPLRARLIKLLARSTWRQEPSAVRLRAFLGTVAPPSMTEYRAGKRARTFTCLAVYDFHREAKSGEHPSP